MNNFFLQKFNIPCYDTDMAQKLKPVAFMNYAQEMANGHASVLGFGYDDMIRTRTAWVLSRIHIKFLRHPEWRETVNLRTWHKGPEGLFYLRDFKMTDGNDGNVLALATTSWLVVNIDTRRLVREAILDEGSVCKEDAISPSCGKIRIPDNCPAEFAAVHKVSYSDVDMNGHANNAMYIQWSMDVIDGSVTLKKPLKELKVNFNHEILAGESVALYLVSVPGEDIYYVEGRKQEDGKDGTVSFCVEMVF